MSGMPASDARAWLDAASIDPGVLELRPDYRALLVVADGLWPGPSDDVSEKFLAAAEAEARTLLLATSPDAHLTTRLVTG